MNPKAIVAQPLPKDKPIPVVERAHGPKPTPVDHAAEAFLEGHAWVMTGEDWLDAVGTQRPDLASQAFELTTKLRKYFRQLARLLEAPRGEPWLVGGAA